MQRRSFLGGLAGIMVAGFAPAAVGSNVLMPVKKILMPQVLMLEDIKSGKITSTRIDSRGLVIKDQQGKVIFWAGTDGNASFQGTMNFPLHFKA